MVGGRAQSGLSRAIIARVSQLRRSLPQGVTLPEETWRTRHRAIVILLWLHAPVILVLSILNGLTVPHSLLESGVVVGAAVLASVIRGGRTLRASVASLGLLTCSALLVHVTGGYIEMHFHFFVMLAVITLYQDWVPFLVALGYVVLEHGLGGALVPTAVYNHPDAWENPWKWAGIHAIFVLGASAACIASWRLDEAARRDLTEQHQVAEQARSETRAILDAATEAMVLIGPDSRVRSVNRRFREFFLSHADANVDVVGRRLGEVHADVEQVFGPSSGVRAVLAAAAAEPQREYRAIVQQQWPQARELELTSTPVPSADGQYLGRLNSFRDVTREREIDRMKTEFVSLVSHELRTPLTSIKGYVDLLLDGDVGDVTAEQAAFLETVKSNADRLVGLINDLLDVSRIESGKIELQRSPVDLARLVRSASEALKPQIQAKDQELTFELDGVPPTVSADADRVIQIVTNLVSNAHKYTPAGGRITVRLQQQPGWVRVEVQDTGIGMTADEQEQLFTKFFRANNRTTQEVGGTGLGLTITRSLVEMHGGEITVTSEPGGGSTFAFTLPFTATTEPTAAEPDSPEPSSAGGCVLVVDDEPDIANLIRRYLVRAGYRVLVAHTAAAAFQIAREQRPDAITLDVMLPDVDGLTLLQWLKGESATAEIPVLLLSVMPAPGDGALLGAVDHLTKPVKERVLLDRIRALLPGTTTRRVLVADDEPDLRRLIAGHLRKAGHRVVEASNGHEAVDAVRRERPDLALIDVKMPELDGLGVLRHLRADPATRDVAVILMSSSPGVLDSERSTIEALGGTTLLEKPCTPEELADVLAQGLRQRSLV